MVNHDTRPKHSVISLLDPVSSLHQLRHDLKSFMSLFAKTRICDNYLDVRLDIGLAAAFSVAVYSNEGPCGMSRVVGPTSLHTAFRIRKHESAATSRRIPYALLNQRPWACQSSFVHYAPKSTLSGFKLRAPDQSYVCLMNGINVHLIHHCQY